MVFLAEDNCKRRRHASIVKHKRCRITSTEVHAEEALAVVLPVDQKIVLNSRKDMNNIKSVETQEVTLSVTRGVHPSEAMMHFPLFEISPYFRKKFQTPWKIFPISAFPKKILIFMRQISDDLF